jgi:phi13 family phage major tail protein
MTLNQKSYIGADNLYYALVTQDDSSGYVAGTPAYLAPFMSISVKPKTNSKVQYADNQPFDSLSSEGESEADVEITGLPSDLQATLLGKVWDNTNGRMYDNGATPPYVAIGYRAKKSGGNYKYYWYLKCQFSPFDEEAASETDSPDPKSTK